MKQYHIIKNIATLTTTEQEDVLNTAAKDGWVLHSATTFQFIFESDIIDDNSPEGRLKALYTKLRYGTSPSQDLKDALVAFPNPPGETI